MSSEFAELLSIWYTEEELKERIREFDNLQAKIIGRKEGADERGREIATNLIRSGMSLEEVSQMTKLPVETLESLQT